MIAGCVRTLLAFAGVRPGMKVFDMGAGGGYSTELLARAVAPGGIVYGQNPTDLPEKPKTTFEARLNTPAMKNVVADIRPFDDPVPPDVHDLDLITFLFFYHDTTYMNVDRAEMDRKLFAALKPGGFMIVADHSALPVKAYRSAKPCIASRKAPCGRKWRRRASTSLPKAISGESRTIHMASPVTSRRCRSIISSSSFRNRCEKSVTYAPAIRRTTRKGLYRFATPAAMPWPMRATTHAPCRPTWATKTFSTR